MGKIYSLTIIGRFFHKLNFVVLVEKSYIRCQSIAKKVEHCHVDHRHFIALDRVRKIGDDVEWLVYRKLAWFFHNTQTVRWTQREASNGPRCDCIRYNRCDCHLGISSIHGVISPQPSFRKNCSNVNRFFNAFAKNGSSKS